VNAGFQERRRTKSDAPRRPQNALLAGLLVCHSCQRPMVATYAAKGSSRFRYYVCQKARQNGWRTCPTKSVSARQIEESLVSQLAARLSVGQGRSRLPISEQDWGAFLDGHPATLIRKIIEDIQCDGEAGLVRVKLRTLECSDEPSTFEYPLLNRRNRALPAFQPQTSTEPTNQPAQLARLVALAHKLEAQVRSGEAKDYRELARRAQVSPERIGQIVIFSQLAPEIQEYILFLSAEHAGLITEPALRKIARELRWDRQRASFSKLTGTVR